MKTLIATIALLMAAPAVAQTADPHAGHGTGHEQHKDCCHQKDADGTRKDCCEKGKDGKLPACCEKHAKQGDRDAHAGHDMSKH